MSTSRLISLLFLIAAVVLLLFFLPQRCTRSEVPEPEPTPTVSPKEEVLPSLKLPSVPTPKPVVITPPIKIAILGEGAFEGEDGLGFNLKILKALLKQISEQNVDAVFFTGDMATGTVKTEGGRIYDADFYRKRLEAFNQTYTHFLGKTPFYPVLGYEESMGEGSSEAVKKVFNLQESFSYGVSIGPAYFLILPTVFFDPEKNKTVEHWLDPRLLGWIEEALQARSEQFRYLFVLGYDPGYSTPSLKDNPKGLDIHPDARDKFWTILTDTGVLAYISGNEHLYDRSLRHGVWQIITGGAGSPLQAEERGSPSFYHYMILEIPHDAAQTPVIRVYDIDGHLRDELPLTSDPSALYQLRILGMEVL